MSVIIIIALAIIGVVAYYYVFKKDRATVEEALSESKETPVQADSAPYKIGRAHV